MPAKHQNRKADVLIYLFVTVVYALVWCAVFSRMQPGPYLVLAVCVALAYASGQAYAMMAQGKLALSADGIALPVSLVMMIVVVFVMVRYGWLPAGMGTYLTIVIPFFSTLFFGHVAVLAVVFVADKVINLGKA